MRLHKSTLRRTAADLKRLVTGTITHVSVSEPVAALTFDDGPDAEHTPRLLSLLDRFGAAATFFMIGEAAEKNPCVVEMVASAGHAVGNHSWDHPSFPQISLGEQWRQLRKCERALAPHGQKLFRPPFGHQTAQSRLLAWGMGYQVVTWSLVAADWLDNEAEWMADHVEKEMRPGSIVLFHDSLRPVLNPRYGDRGRTLKAVELVLSRLGDQFQFVTVPQLLARGRAQKKDWQVEGKPEFFAQLREPDGGQWRYASATRMSGRLN